MSVATIADGVKPYLLAGVELDGAKVFSFNVTSNNGIMHSLGVVLVPKSLDGFADLDK